MTLDIAFGILVALGVHQLLGVELTPLLLLMSVFFALSPDIDVPLFFLWRKIQRRLRLKGTITSHRNILHNPLIFVPVGWICISLFSLTYASMFAVLALLHFLHDSIGIGFGVAWLYPFSKTRFSFLYQHDVWQHGLPRQLVYAWTPEKIRSTAELSKNRSWLRHIYLRLHPYSLIEHVTLLVAVILLLVGLS